MLTKLIVENYALIGRLDIDFPEGLIIITGETGAGKSILLGALSLILGAKSDETVLKDKSRNCIVEAEFTVDSDLLAHLAGEGYEASDKVILRRVITPAGRSRSFLNDEPVSMKVLSAISGMLVDIHAQHQHLLLADQNFQRKLLDNYAATEKDLALYRTAYSGYCALQDELKALDRLISESNAEYEYKIYRYGLLKDVSLRNGMLEELDAEHRILANAEEIRSQMGAVCDRFSPGGVSLSQSLKEASSALHRLASYDSSFSSLSDRISTCRIELDDIYSEIFSMLEKVEVSPERLDMLESEISLITSLLRKFSVRDVSELIAIKEKLASELDAAENYDARREELLKKIADQKALLDTRADILYRKRSKAAAALSEKVSCVVRGLEMPKASLSYEVRKKNVADKDGADEIKLLFSANQGMPMQEISRSASGGEISRIALAVKSVMASYTGMPTMIFDEIDTGVSGRVADRMGAVIADLAKNVQVIAITHLPQIATRGCEHLVVYKAVAEDGITESRIRKVTGDDRVREIAAMLSGSTLGDAAMANAKELLNMNTDKNK